MTKIEKTVYFKNLDGLRFLAAFAVIIGHCQSHIYAERSGLIVYAPYAYKLANFGVDFFFVLSGFLITYLLIQEINKTCTINIRFFYARRFLRIWPVYFLVGIIGLTFGKFFLDWVGFTSNGFALSQQAYTLKDYFTSLAFLGTFSINIQAMIGWHMGVSSLMVGHFWSLAIEEQFYLIWAPAMYFFKKYTWIIILLFTIIGLGFHFIPVENVKQYTEFHINFTGNRFFHFGLGGILAWVLHHISFYKIKHYLTNFFKNNILIPSVSARLGLSSVQVFNTLWAIVLIAIQIYCLWPMLKYVIDVHLSDADQRLKCGFISLAIITAAIMDYSIINILWLESQLFKYLGKISFGIYIFHVIAIRLAEKILEPFHLPLSSNAFLILFPLFSTLIAIGLASISYEFFEKRFLKMKTRYHSR